MITPVLPSVGIGNCAFTINGQPEILLAETVPPVSLPRELWDKRLAKAKRGGINTLEILLQDSVSPADLENFWEACREQGIYVHLNSTALSAIDAWIPTMVAEQWTNGGSIILVETTEGTSLHELVQQGITVPILHHVEGRTVVQEESAWWQYWAVQHREVRYHVRHEGRDIVFSPFYCHFVRDIAKGQRAWQRRRRLALWVQTFQEILLTGEYRDTIRTTDALRAYEFATKQRGSVLFVVNPAEETVTGSVIPYLPDITLKPGEVFPWVHDVPIGASNKYLAAYAGLVKSDALVLTMHLLPDPWEGVRVMVYGTPGTTQEVVLFNAAGGESVSVTFAETPQVYRVGPSQVIALSPELAEKTFVCPTDANASVLIGVDDVLVHSSNSATVELSPEVSTPFYSLQSDGTLVALPTDFPHPTLPDFDDSSWLESDEPTSMARLGSAGETVGWYRAVVNSDEAFDAELHFAAFADRLMLWVNGEYQGAFSVGEEAIFAIRLQPGRNILCVQTEGSATTNTPMGIWEAVTLIPFGACYLMDIARWKFYAGTPIVEIAL